MQPLRPSVPGRCSGHTCRGEPSKCNISRQKGPTGNGRIDYRVPAPIFQMAWPNEQTVCFTRPVSLSSPAQFWECTSVREKSQGQHDHIASASGAASDNIRSQSVPQTKCCWPYPHFALFVQQTATEEAQPMDADV